MPRSLANGDYSLVMAIESTSRANSWYRVLAERRTWNLSCDCPAWTFNQGGGDQLDLDDGLTPIQRAENTLHLFLGEELYRQLEHQHFLDVSSVRYAANERVYRVRRDPAKRRERRVRVFEKNRYINDYCIVRAQAVPEADHWLTVFLHLLSDEDGALSVVQSYNVFGPHSDDYPN
jgi:hypothetical protein